MNIAIERACSSEDMAAYCDIVRASLPLGNITVEEFAQSNDIEKVRVARLADEVVGGLMLMPMGQYYGGRAVPMIGVHAVAVAPQHRGKGAGTSLMRAAIGEIADRDVPLCTLYPATQPVYRNVGFEQAGTLQRMSVPVGSFDVGSRDLEVTSADWSDRDDLDGVYRQSAQWRTGHLERSEWCWRRILRPRRGIARAYRVRERGRTTGYIVTAQEWKTEGPASRLVVKDMCALTEAARLRLFTFIADHRSLVDDVVMAVVPAGDSLIALREPAREVASLFRWMSRIVDLPAALAARGYPDGLRMSLELDVRDPLIEGNDGRLVLEVHDGEAEVSRGGKGSFVCGIDALAPLYTGQVSARGFAAAGRVAASEESLRAASAIFAGPAPCMMEMF